MLSSLYSTSGVIQLLSSSSVISFIKLWLFFSCYDSYCDDFIIFEVSVANWVPVKSTSGKLTRRITVPISFWIFSCLFLLASIIWVILEFCSLVIRARSFENWGCFSSTELRLSSADCLNSSRLFWINLSYCSGVLNWVLKLDSIRCSISGWRDRLTGEIASGLWFLTIFGFGLLVSEFCLRAFRSEFC